MGVCLSEEIKWKRHRKRHRMCPGVARAAVTIGVLVS